MDSFNEEYDDITNSLDTEGNNHIHTLTINNLTDMAIMMIIKFRNHPEIIDKKNKNGQRPIDLSVTYNRFEIFKCLLANGIDKNSVNNMGNTLLNSAVLLGGEYIDHLLMLDVDINKTNKYGQGALCYSVCENKIDSLIKLLNHGADPNVKDAQDCSLLFYAIDKQKIRNAKNFGY